MPASTVSRGEFPETLTHMLTEAGMAASGKQVKDALGRSAVTVNNQPVSWQENAEVHAVFDPARALYGRYFLVRLGKKKYHLFEVE
jgi:tyrosyl-tRNA synthetase